MGVRRTATQVSHAGRAQLGCRHQERGASREGAIGDVLPFALVVTISPINIIAAIVLLFSKRPVVNAASYVVGFVVGVAAMLGALVAIAGTLTWPPDRDGHGRGGIRIALGVALLVAAIAKFRSAPKAGEPASFQVDGRPRNVRTGEVARSRCADRSAQPEEHRHGNRCRTLHRLSRPHRWPTGRGSGVYVVLAVLGVAAPVVVALVLGDRSQPVLASWKAWLERNNRCHGRAVPRVLRVLVGKGIAAV